MKVGFFSLGCRVNCAESESLKRQLLEVGFDIVSKEEAMDICVINSCSVTATSDKKTRQLVSRANRKGAFVALIGCFVTAFPEKVAALRIDLALSNKEKMTLPGLLRQRFAGKLKASRQSVGAYAVCKTRAFLKIQDGCNRACAYCIIPKARGGSCSKRSAEIKAELNGFVAAGFKEVVLVGINLLLYGCEIGEKLIDVIEMVCASPGIQRVRLSSLEPEAMVVAMLKRLASQEKFCPHFHISLQSGSNRTLKAMNRCYTAEWYEESIHRIRDLFENPAITTDVIVGFPGETEEDFLESLAFIGKMKFAKVHIFPYSKRPGTEAAAMQGQVSSIVKAERCKRLAAASQNSQLAFLKNMVGKREKVLFENVAQDGALKGYTANYVRVSVRSEKDLVNRLVAVKILDANEDGCFGAEVD